MRVSCEHGRPYPHSPTPWAGGHGRGEATNSLQGPTWLGWPKPATPWSDGGGKKTPPRYEEMIVSASWDDLRYYRYWSTLTAQAQENLRMAHAKEISNVRSRATEDVMAAKHQLRQLRKDLDTLKRTSQAELHAKELSHLKEIDEREIKASMHAQEQFDRQIEKLKALEAEHARSEVSIREKLREENKSLRAQIREKSRIHQDEMNKHVAKHNLELAKVKEKLNESQELL